MQLFSYMSKSQVRSARLIGQSGIDICNAAKLYFQSYNKFNTLKFQVLPCKLEDLLQLGSDALELISTATDWAAECCKQKSISLCKDIIFQFDEAKLTTPIVRPGKVICIAGNYPAVNKMDRPEYPTVFLKPSGGVIGHHESVVIPKICESVAYEVELAVVIGKQCKNLKTEEANSVIAGYTLANDLGDRLLEKRTSQWTSGKMFDTFTPMGPVVFTSDEIDDANNLNIYTKVNNEVVQKGSTSDMFFSVSQIVSYVSTLTTLECGDIILTGSPKMMDGKPNPACDLKMGDVVEVGIDGLAALINPIISDKR